MAKKSIEIRARPENNFFKTDKFSKITTIIDCKGIEHDVYGSESLAYCPAVALYLHVSGEVWENDLGHPYTGLGSNRRMIWAQHNDLVVGGICYEYEEESRVGAIILGFVHPKYRRRGIYTRMHAVWENEIRGLGGVRVYAQVHVDNIPQLRALEGAGLRPYYYRLQQWISD